MSGVSSVPIAMSAVVLASDPMAISAVVAVSVPMDMSAVIVAAMGSRLSEQPSFVSKY